MIEVLACYYSFSDSQILVGGVDEQNNLVITQGHLYRKIPISHCANLVIKISGYERPVWINSHELFKKVLARRGVAGEVDLSQEDGQIKDLFLSLKLENKIKTPPDFEAVGDQFSMALKILVKALSSQLSGMGMGAIPQDACGYSTPNLEHGEIDTMAEYRECLKMFDV
jgi:hypothetical protein